MKKSKLRKLIRNIIKEQFRRDNIGISGKRLPLNKTKQIELNVIPNNRASINQTMNKLVELGKITQEQIPIIQNKLPQIVQDLNRKKFGDCDCTHPPSMGFCLLGICIGKGSGRTVSFTFNI